MGQISQLIEYLFHKYKDFSFIPEDHIKMLGIMVSHTYNPCTKNVKVEESLRLSGGDSIPKNGTQGCSLASICKHRSLHNP